jgi:hypothetical protein
MSFLSIFKASDTFATNTARPEERRAQLEQIVRDHAALREAVGHAQVAFETHDRFLRDRYLNPAQPAAVGIEDDVEEQRRRSLRYALGEAQLALAEFEKTHDVKAVEAELADIRDNADERERGAARQKLIDLMMAFEADILQPGAARWTEIAKLGDEIERRWPNQRLTTDLPHIPPGVFTTGGGLRSVPIWFHESMCVVAPEAFPADDPIRLKIERMKAERKIVIWHPLPLEWR